MEDTLVLDFDTDSIGPWQKTQPESAKLGAEDNGNGVIDLTETETETQHVASHVDEDGAIVIDESPQWPRGVVSQSLDSKLPPPPPVFLLLDSDDEAEEGVDAPPFAAAASPSTAIDLEDLDVKPAAVASRARRRRQVSSLDLDRAVAMSLQEQERSEQIREDLGLALAAKLQRREKNKATRVRRKEAEKMQETTPGRAFHFIEKIIARHGELVDRLRAEGTPEEALASLDTVAKDDMVFLAERFIDMQNSFREADKPWKIDLGYHYTREENMDNIRVGGLLTKADREKQNIQSNFNGSALGDGVYTADNPVASQRYGPVGLLVARLQGDRQIWTPSTNNNIKCDTVFNMPSIPDRSTSQATVVLRQSAQCLPLIRFSKDAVGPATALFEKEVQTLIDETLNRSPKRKLPDVTFDPEGDLVLLDDDWALLGPENKRKKLRNTLDPPSPSKPQVSYRPPAKGGLPQLSNGTFHFKAPRSLKKKPTLSQLYRTIPASEAATGEECPLCLDQFSDSKSVCLNACGHSFHLHCLEESFKTFKKCPNCRKTLDPPQGTSPTGTMTISGSAHRCQGFSLCRSIAIEYSIPNGKQHSYHPKPGKPYKGTSLKAFVPDNAEGNKLVRRLVHAFRNGMTFRVSVANKTILGTIPHKRKTKKGGADGFPDPEYFANANEALDELGVPRV